jgi:crotonobetainyl-CoA:carnitine CoA-transferase CaiB-like acyl-CoA transferase
VTLSGGESAGQTIKIPAIPVEMNQRKFDVRRDLPTEGRDSLEVLEELGYSPDELKLMMEEGVIRQT